MCDDSRLTTDKSQAPIGGWAEDLRLREVGEFAQMCIEADIEGL